jgi:hypothetical protein
MERWRVFLANPAETECGFADFGYLSFEDLTEVEVLADMFLKINRETIAGLYEIITRLNDVVYPRFVPKSVSSWQETID